MPNRHAAPTTDHGHPSPQMKRMLQCLPIQHQEIIVATYFRGRTTDEAADLLGLPPATAKARLFHAMSDLSLMLSVRHQARATPHRRSQPAGRHSELPRGSAEYLRGVQ